MEKKQSFKSKLLNVSLIKLDIQATFGSIRKADEHLPMSYNGLIKALSRGTVKVGVLEHLCELLGHSPARYFPAPAGDSAQYVAEPMEQNGTRIDTDRARVIESQSRLIRQLETELNTLRAKLRKQANNQ